MRIFFTLSLVLLVTQLAVAPPVTKNQKASEDADKEKEGGEVSDGPDMDVNVEYTRYLKEVVHALESDPDFREKLQKAEEVDIRTGKIAHELEFVNHQVRSKLDELKRQELERLRHIALKEYRRENGLDPDHIKIAEHLDYTNHETFEINDLKKLILKTTADLAEVDRKRREEFKEYEMQKKFEQEIKMKGMSDEEKKNYENEIHSQEEKHKNHQPLHHPGSKQQLEEVWEKQDHMENQDFDPRTFFYLHDLDGNGVWDQDEVKALFLKELDKMYADGVPEDDLRERAEEMERMREHVFSEADLDKDGLLSYNEFLEQTKKPDFQQDEGWQGLDEQQIYSQQEYEEFERRRQADIQNMIAKGMLPPDAANYPPGQLPQQFPSQHGNAPPHQGNSQQEFIEPMGARVHPNEIPQGQQHQGQQNVHQQQFQGQQQYGQVPQQQQHQQFQGQVPPQHQQQQQQQHQQQQQQQFQGHAGNQQPVQNAVPVANQVPNTGNVNVANQQQQVVQQQPRVPQQPNIVQSNQNIVPNAVNTHS